MRLDAEVEVAQDLGPQAVAQTDVLEPNHVPLRRAAAPPMRTLYRNANSIGVGLPFGRFNGLARRLGAIGSPVPHGFRSVNEGQLACSGKPPGTIRRC